MALFKRRKSRATRRAEARAIKVKAKMEAKLSAKNETRRIKAANKAETRALKAQLRAQRDSDRAALRVAETQLKAAREGKLFSATRIRRVLTVARLLAPIAVPIVYRASIAARGLVDERRADRLGVPLSQLGQFSGHGAELSARIAGAEQSLRLVAGEEAQGRGDQTVRRRDHRAAQRSVGRGDRRREHAVDAQAVRSLGHRHAARRDRCRPDGPPGRRLTTMPHPPTRLRVLTALVTVVLAALALAGAGPAAAHAARIAADPAEDTVLTASPQRVTATFNEPMQKAFAAMTVVGPDGNLWSTGEPEVADALVSVGVRPLGPAGDYTVNYRLTSADGHVVTGSWSFALDVAGTGTPGPSATATPAAPPDRGVPVWPFVVVGALIVAAGVWWAVRRRT